MANFTDYDTACKLKELGFKEVCYGFFANSNEFNNPVLEYKCKNEKHAVTAPLWQQVEEWLWKEHQAYVKIGIDRKKYIASLVNDSGSWNFVLNNERMDSPYSAKMDGLKEAVKYIHEYKTK
jgi:hypothetical protein